MNTCPSICMPFFSQFNLLKMIFSVGANRLGDMVLLCVDPLWILMFSFSSCMCTVTGPSVCLHFRIYMYTSSIPCYCNNVNIVWVCIGSNA